MSGETIFITTGKPSAAAARPASAADRAIAALGKGIAHASQSFLHSAGESALRPLAFAAWITACTAERS
jgi:hypothetical protein